MAYEHLYQRRRTATPDQAAASPQPNGVSFVEHMRRLHPPNIDASAGLNESERAQVREWRRLIDANLLGFGTIIPAHLLAAVYGGCAPQSAPSLLEASSDPTARIARQITAGMSMSSPLATDRDHPRTLATDQPGRPRNDIAPDHAELRRHDPSPKLKHVMGGAIYMDHETFQAAMKRCDVLDIAERIRLTMEAEALGLLPRPGAPMRPPARYIPAPHLSDPTVQHFIHKDSKEAEKSTAGRPGAPGKKHVTTIQASDAQGFCAYDGTGINLL